VELRNEATELTTGTVALPPAGAVGITTGPVGMTTGPVIEAVIGTMGAEGPSTTLLTTGGTTTLPVGTTTGTEAEGTAVAVAGGA